MKNPVYLILNNHGIQFKKETGKTKIEYMLTYFKEIMVGAKWINLRSNRWMDSK